MEPDIVIFGKKTQLSGIMVKDEFAQIFSQEDSGRLEVTWDGDISDMIRCKYIIKAYEKYDILSNVEKMSKLLSSSLSQMPEILNLRNCGLIFGFDLTSTRYRDILIKNAYENGMICNIAGKTSIRLRPSLSVTEKDIEQATSIFKSSMRK